MDDARQQDPRAEQAFRTDPIQASGTLAGAIPSVTTAPLAIQRQTTMPPIIFTCPNTREKVQHWLPDDPHVSEDDYEGVVCERCTRFHFVNRKGKVMGAEGS
jgi:hypothetical protein